MNDDVTLRNQVITIVSIGAVSAIQALLWSDSSFNSLTRLPGRVGNLHRDRESSLLEVRSWDDDMFRRQFRLNRCDFNDLLQIIAPYLTTCATYARNSSGSAICPELRLLIALRVLAGASYLDMIWYNVSINHVMSLVVNVCKCINEHVDNISFPSYGDEDGYRALQDGWKRRIYRKFGGMGVGILDGIAFCITEPRASDLDGKSSSSYMNRKGFFALITQAFCDSYCRFLYFDTSWPGSTGDCTAFEECVLYAALKNGLAPAWALFACDEAYSSFGGNILTPFSSIQLKKSKRGKSAAVPDDVSI